MKYYVYETTPTYVTPTFGVTDNEYIIEHTLVYDYITGTNDLNKIFKKVGFYPYPKQLKQLKQLKQDGIMIIGFQKEAWSLGKLIIVCCSETAAEKFEKQILKNNLKCKKQNNNPFNTVDFNIYHNSKEKEKRLLFTKYSAK